MNLIVFLVFCASSALVAVRHYFVTVRPRDRLRPIFRKELSALTFAAQFWQGSEYSLVDYDTDRDPVPDRTWRTLRLQPKDDVRWRIQIRPDRGYQLQLKVAATTLWFPESSGWRDEPWIKAEINALLSAIAKLPPPRTFDEYLEELKRALETFPAKLPPDFPSLDDPMDDMD